SYACLSHLAVVILYLVVVSCDVCFFFFQAEDGIRDRNVTGVQTCALPISYTKLIESAKQQPEYHYDQIDGTIVGFYAPTLFHGRSEEHTSELQSRFDLVCRLLLVKKNQTNIPLSQTLITVSKAFSRRHLTS